MTMRDVIFRSFRLLGLTASGETPGASEIEDAITSLNAMLDSWGLERLFVYSTSAHTYSFIAGKQVYTIGPGGDFDQERPNVIDQAYILWTANAAQPATIPMKILNIDQWASKQTKQVTSTFPTEMYSDSNSPLSNLSFWPVPNQITSVVLWTWNQLGSFDDSTISDDLTFPPGYAKAIAFNLAVELAPEYGKQVTTEVATGANESKANIKRINAPDLLMVCDSALVHRGGWDYRIGESR